MRFPVAQPDDYPGPPQDRWQQTQINGQLSSFGEYKPIASTTTLTAITPRRVDPCLAAPRGASHSSKRRKAATQSLLGGRLLEIQGAPGL